MTRTKTPSKFDYDPLLFKAEPPESPRLIKKLFCGRKEELRRGTQILKKFSDVRGKRAARYDKRPWVIHGESRSGKSHLARRILCDLPKNQKRIQVSVSARERLAAREVMRNLFEELKVEFALKTRDQTLDWDPYETPVIQATEELLGRIAAFLPGAESVDLTLSETTKRAIESGIETSLIPQVFKFLLRVKAQKSSQKTLTITLRPPTVEDYGEYCAILVDSLRVVNLVDHVLLFVDDVDLLEGYWDADRNGKMERSILSHALNDLHQSPGVDVLLTARSWYAHSLKEFQTLVDLGHSQPMDLDDLIRIHDLRFEALTSKRLPRTFLEDAALRSAADDVHGLPGVFLQHLDTAFHIYQGEEDWNQRDYSWYLGVFRNLYSVFKLKCPAAAECLEDAVVRGTLTVDVRDGNPFQSTIFDSMFVFQSYYQETTYFMDSLVHKVVQSSRPQPIEILESGS